MIRRVVTLVDFVCCPLQPLPSVERSLPLCPVGFLFGLAGPPYQPLPAEMRGGEFSALYALPPSSFLDDELMLPMLACFGPLELPLSSFLG
jgi:hypothetical protein